MPEARGWLAPALILVAGVTALRMLALAFNRTDLFVDEAQYWLWGQRLDFGYYSKPPLIAWVIRAFTSLLGDTAFAIRLPGMLFHAATALILAALAARLWGARAAVWVAVSYVTLPFVAVGSLLISTDTILAPFYAGALLLWFRACQDRRAGPAFAAGLLLGIAALAKYAAAYFLLGAALAAIVVPALRGTPRLWLLLLAGFALALTPNVIWNLSHDLTTVAHTMDNVGWVRREGGLTLHPDKLAEFFFSQFAVFGPVLFAALLAAFLAKGDPFRRALLAFSLPALVIVCGQALMERAYANWAVTAYFAAVVAVVPWLLARAPRLLAGSVAINAAICVALPLLTVLAPWPLRDGQPLLARYLGQADLSRQIIAAARGAGVQTVMAPGRDVLADLFLTGRDSGLSFRAPARQGRAMNYYEQTFPVRADTGPVLAVLDTAPVCDGVEQLPVVRFDTRIGAYRKVQLAGYLIGGDCAATLD